MQLESAAAWIAQVPLPWLLAGGLALILLVIALQRFAHSRRNAGIEAHLAELEGSLKTMVEMTAQREAQGEHRLDEFSRYLTQSLELASVRLGDNLAESGRRTSENLTALNERLAVIEEARRSLSHLSSEVLSLQGVLANKQARGAFGQGRMETIIRDALPAGTFKFQATLSNGKRPDCLIYLPNTPAPVVIDSKFPLEGFEALRVAVTPEDKKTAAKMIRVAVGRHIDEIANKYLIAGETQDTALMFVPSESIYADLHETFSDLVQRAHRERIVIVAPNILMLAVQTMQAVIKDVKMRDHAGVIQKEVGLLLVDVARLTEGISDLKRNFDRSREALEKVSASAGRITERGAKVHSLDFEEERVSEVEPRRKLSATG